MRFRCLVCLLIAGLISGQLSFAQAAPPASPAAPAGQSAPAAPPAGAPAAAPEVKVAPDDPVITLKGFCADSSLQGDACKTVITRAQFEKLVDALQPNMPAPLRRQLANRYSQILRMSTAAEKRDLDKKPSFEVKMQFARMQILSQELGAALQEDSAKISDADIADYYQKNEATYVQASLQRIFIPRSKQSVNQPPKTRAAKEKEAAAAAKDKDKDDKDDDDKAGPPPAPTDAQKKAAEDSMTKLAVTIHEEAVKGEDFDKLQKEAFVAAGLPGNAVNTKVEKARRATLPLNHQAVMDLKPGDVSDVITDANNGHYIYKMVSKETLTLETVSPEIRKLISGQRYRDAMQAFQGNVDLNDAYFGAARTPGMPPTPRGLRPNPGQAQDPD